MKLLALMLAGAVLLPFWSLSRGEQRNYRDPENADYCMTCGTEIPAGDDLCEECADEDDGF